MSNILLGEIPAGDAERDATHVAVLPATAGKMLFPAQRVALKEGKAFADEDAPVGIVDPFLRHSVPEGERFWLCLLPGSVTDMRHHWTCPRVEAQVESKKDVSKRWMEQFAVSAGLSYEWVMEITKTFLDTGEHWVEPGSQQARDAAVDAGDAFWDHYKVLTGREISDDFYGRAPFCCAC